MYHLSLGSIKILLAWQMMCFVEIELFFFYNMYCELNYNHWIMTAYCHVIQKLLKIYYVFKNKFI